MIKNHAQEIIKHEPAYGTTKESKTEPRNGLAGKLTYATREKSQQKTLGKKRRKREKGLENEKAKKRFQTAWRRWEKK